MQKKTDGEIRSKTAKAGARKRKPSALAPASASAARAPPRFFPRVPASSLLFVVLVLAIVRMGAAAPISEASNFRAMHDKILQGAKKEKTVSGAFLAALDQSGGSTPKALESYGLSPDEGNYEVGSERYGTQRNATQASQRMQ